MLEFDPKTPADEQGSEEFVDVYRMVDGADPFKNIHRLRDEKKADIVGLLVDDPRGCGLSTRVAPDAEDAYFVAYYSYAAITIAITHEIGHILGARHDRLTDPSDTPFPYGHGYVDGTKWRDIMSYAETCDGCVRIPTGQTRPAAFGRLLGLDRAPKVKTQRRRLTRLAAQHCAEQLGAEFARMHVDRRGHLDSRSDRSWWRSLSYFPVSFRFCCLEPCSG